MDPWDTAVHALRHAQAWIGSAPHGDNCFVSSHYDGDPGDRCNCGRDGALDAVDAALAAVDIRQTQTHPDGASDAS